MNAQHTLLAALMAAALVIAPTWVPPVAAAEVQDVQPKDGWYKNLVDFEFMKQQVEIPPKPGVAIIDARPAARKYDVGHIPGAINIPETQFDKHVDKLPADKNTLLIFYCEGEKCMLSHRAAQRTEAMGYTNIRVYPGGYPEWAAKGMIGAVSAAHIKKLLDEKAPGLLIDARPARVFASGSIPGAINIPETQFDKHLDKLPADKATPLIFFCGGLKCVLSEKAAARAKALGYSNVMTYPEGYPEWEKLQGVAPSQTAAAAAATGNVKPLAVSIEPGKEKGSISVASFKRILQENPDGILIVDVRDAKEFKAAALKGSINIPINDLEKKMDSLPKGKPIVFVCGTGGRAGEAYDSVKMLRNDLDVWFLNAEITFNPDGTCSC